MQLSIGSGQRKPIPFCEHYAGIRRYILKALALQIGGRRPFDVTIDLEDGAPRGEETKHLSEVVAILHDDVQPGQRVGVRTHEFDSDDWHTEARELIHHGRSKLSYLTVPKVQDAGQARAIVDAVRMLSFEYKLERPVPLHLLLESRAGVHNVWSIAAVPGLEALDFGVVDFIADYAGVIPAEAMEYPEQFANALIHRAKTEISCAAHHYGLTPSHCVTLKMDRESAYRDASLARRRYGFTRMYSVHPDQIDGIIDAMSPTVEEIQDAVELLELARRNRWGPIRWREKLHDGASYRYYISVLRNARLAGRDFPAELTEFADGDAVAELNRL